MGCLVQAMGETLVTKVSVEIGKHISLLSNRALGPVLHSLIQMRVPHMGLAKIDSRYLSLTDTHTATSTHSFDLALLCSLSGMSSALSFSHLSFASTTVMQKWRNLQDPSVFWTFHRLLWIRSLILELCSDFRIG